MSKVAVIDANPPGGGWFRRRNKKKANRRVAIQRRTLGVWLADGLSAFGRGAWKIGKPILKLALFAGCLVGAVVGGRWAIQHVVASPRFAVRSIAISPTVHAAHEELEELAGVEEGDRLLAIDTDVVAARVAAHPWIAEVRVERQLPSELRIDVVERQAAALVNLGGLYLVDRAGHPFKRATMAEAAGLPVLSGIDRTRYLEERDASEAALREALALHAEYATVATRPTLSEIAIDDDGYALYLLDGGGEIRLGRGDHSKKLARFDQILEALTTKGATARTIRVVHLDGASRDRIAARFEPNAS